MYGMSSQPEALDYRPWQAYKSRSAYARLIIRIFGEKPCKHRRAYLILCPSARRSAAVRRGRSMRNIAACVIEVRQPFWREKLRA